MSNENCTMCGNFIKEEGYRTLMYPEGHYDIDIGPFCPKCWEERVFICEECYRAFDKRSHTPFGRNWVCKECE